uniref:Exodeoxyribonuclease 7 large subunit n=1 Tax=Lygus hesperus TaxID=30085 RepID=A0A0A9X678_LYGHE
MMMDNETSTTGSMESQRRADRRAVQATGNEEDDGEAIRMSSGGDALEDLYTMNDEQESVAPQVVYHTHPLPAVTSVGGGGVCAPTRSASFNRVACHDGSSTLLITSISESR